MHLHTSSRDEMTSEEVNQKLVGEMTYNHNVAKDIYSLNIF